MRITFLIAKIESAVQMLKFFTYILTFIIIDPANTFACTSELENIWIPPEYRKNIKINCSQNISRLEEELVASGIAIVYPNNNITNNIKLLALEKSARTKNIGVWNIDKYKIKEADGIDGKYIESFQLVKGKVIDLTLKNRNLYLNFGDNWKNDFTVKIPTNYLRLFNQADMFPKEWINKHIIVRGWLEEYNGPMITVTHYSQIQLLD